MKEEKRTPIIDFNKIKSISKDMEIEGKIIISSYTENETLYILTDCNFFYFKQKNKKAKQFMLIPELSKVNENYQTEENKSHLWCDKYEYHTIIYHDKRAFYFNPSFIDNPKEINIVNTTIQKGIF